MQEEKKYEKPDTNGYTVVPVLHYLSGKLWDDMAMNYIHSLRPSCVRTSMDGKVNADARPWRVTVFLKKDGKTIDWIEQEVEVGLKGCRDGMALRIHLEPVMVDVDQAVLKQMQETLTRMEEETRIHVIEAYTFDPNLLKGSVLCLNNPRVRGIDVIFRYQLNAKEYEVTEHISHIDMQANTFDDTVFKQFISHLGESIYELLMRTCAKAMNRRGIETTFGSEPQPDQQ